MAENPGVASASRYECGRRQGVPNLAESRNDFQESGGDTEEKPKNPPLPAETAASKAPAMVTEDDQARELLSKVAAAETTKKTGARKEQDEYEALAARFEALKKK